MGLRVGQAIRVCANVPNYNGMLGVVIRVQSFRHRQRRGRTIDSYVVRLTDARGAEYRTVLKPEDVAPAPIK